MPDVHPEIKPSQSRFFWDALFTFGAVYLPLTLGVVLWLIYGLELSPAAARTSLIVYGLSALASMVWAAFLISRAIVRRLTSIDRLVRHMAAGEFDRRIPPQERGQIEDLSAALDQAQAYLQARVSDLESSRNQLRTVLDSMLEGVIAVDRDQRVLLVSAAGRRLFPMQDLNVVGRPIWELVRSPQLAQWVAQSLSRSEPVGGELEIKAPQPRILSVRVAGLPGPTIAGAIIVASDISQLRRLEQVRQEFVANASHELKTPLASIKACVETLLDGDAHDPEISVQFLKMIDEQAERLDKLVRDLLALTRIESRESRPVLHPVPLADVVELCVHRHSRNAEHKGMKLLTVPPETPATAIADEESLEQILDNLIDNAIKYTNSGGTITVRWESAGPVCRLHVEDTGIGIPQAHQIRIFERFYRVDRARSRELGGTGLGLSIVKHLSQQMNGNVAVNSRIGKGSTFTVEIPAALPALS